MNFAESLNRSAIESCSYKDLSSAGSATLCKRTSIRCLTSKCPMSIPGCDIATQKAIGLKARSKRRARLRTTSPVAAEPHNKMAIEELVQSLS